MGSGGDEAWWNIPKSLDVESQDIWKAHKRQAPFGRRQGTVLLRMAIVAGILKNLLSLGEVL